MRAVGKPKGNSSQSTSNPKDAPCLTAQIGLRKNSWVTPYYRLVSTTGIVSRPYSPRATVPPRCAAPLSLTQTPFLHAPEPCITQHGALLSIRQAMALSRRTARCTRAQHSYQHFHSFAATIRGSYSVTDDCFRVIGCYRLFCGAGCHNHWYFQILKRRRKGGHPTDRQQKRVTSESSKREGRESSAVSAVQLT